MRNLQLTAGVAVLAVFAFAAAPQVRADGYDYGYGPVYSYPVVSGTCPTCPTCPNGQCGSYYSPAYSASYPVYSTPSCANGSCGLSGSCPNGSCGACSNGMCGLRGQCSTGFCPSGQCSSGQCSDGTCRSGRCGTCPNGDCERGNCSGNCPNGQCSTRYRGPIDPLSRPASPNYDSGRYDAGNYDSPRRERVDYRTDYRPDFGGPDAAPARPSYSTERPSYRDYRDEPVSHRTWRNDSRPIDRDRDLESPFYN